MLTRFLVVLLISFASTSMPSFAQPAPGVAPDTNPLLQPWTTPFEAPPFAAIRPEHFRPAIEAGIAEQKKEIAAIASNPAAPTFENTIVAMENAGELLSRVNSVFGGLQSADTNEQLQKINREVAPLLSAMRDEIRMNPALFARIKAVWEGRERAGLTPEHKKLVEDTYRSFVRGGANLDPEKQTLLKKINAELSLLGIKFGDNLLHDTNGYRLVIEKEADLAGLPPSVIAMGADAAKAAGMAGKWVYTLQAPEHLALPAVRGQLASCGARSSPPTPRATSTATPGTTRPSCRRIAALRAQRSQLLGYKTYADFVVEENMAKTSGAVNDLLAKLWAPTNAKMRQEAAAQQALIAKTGQPFALEPWDWRYFTEKVKQATFDFDDQAMRPYFALDNVLKGAFHVANRLYGLTFIPRPDVPVYHPEVKAFEVRDADGSLLALFYTDFHPRPGKRGGAWTSSFRGTRVKDGKRVIPIVTNVSNFSRPAGDEPALLSRDEVETLFHEFGHALSSMLSKVEFRGLAGYPRDFVELPSQIMENWAFEPEVLKAYAKHYKTGDVIPMDMVQKIQQTDTFNQGFLTGEYLAAAILDMDWHTQTSTEEKNVTSFERESMERIGLPSAVVPRYRSTYFNHIFGPGGGYAAGTTTTSGPT